MQMKHGEAVTTLNAAAIDRHRNWCIARGQSDNTVKAYSTDLRMFLRALETEALPMTEFEELAMSWLNLTRREAAPKTTQRRLTSLRSFGKWAGLDRVLEGYITPQPGRAIPHPLPEGFSGIDRMIAVARTDQQKCLVSLCGFAGLRIGEALTVCVSSIDVIEMLITIRGKGDKTRVIPLSTRCWDNITSTYVLAALLGPSTRLVSYKDSGARAMIRTLGEKAGLQRAVSSHDLRMTFGTEVYNKGLDLRATQELLGHASSTTTEAYTGVSIEKMRAAINF
jgi:integrase/recombinase XerC